MRWYCYCYAVGLINSKRYKNTLVSDCLQNHLPKYTETFRPPFTGRCHKSSERSQQRCIVSQLQNIFEDGRKEGGGDGPTDPELIPIWSELCLMRSMQSRGQDTYPLLFFVHTQTLCCDDEFAHSSAAAAASNALLVVLPAPRRLWHD